MTMTETIMSGQKKQITRFCEDALDDFEKDVAQRVIERGGELQEQLRALVVKLGELPYADEEVASNYSYPDGFKIRSAQEQVNTLLALEPFKGLDASHVEELASRELPEGAEGWGIIPKPDKVGKTYHEALGVAIDLIVKDRKFKNWLEGMLTEEYMKLMKKTVQAHARLNEQSGDFWVVPFQFGIKYRGKSVRRAHVVFTEAEFGLGAYEVAILLLAHPERITRDQLYIDCAGVEYAPSVAGSFWACLGFGWSNGYRQLGLYCERTDSANAQWGSVSAFLPQ